HGESPKTATLSVEGPATVTAADIHTDGEVDVVNKMQYLATLQEGAKLEIEMRVETGKGFVPAEQMKREELPLCWLPIDAVYMPVQKVNYKVENTRVGQITNYDRLVLEVWTNGSIDPDKAISTSAGILALKFQKFTLLGGEAVLLDGGHLLDKGDDV